MQAGSKVGKAGETVLKRKYELAKLRKSASRASFGLKKFWPN